MKTGIGPHDSLKLNLFGELVWEAWGELGYLVGSSQKGTTFRDVDVRVMVSKADFEKWFGEDWQEGKRHRNTLWQAHMLAWSELGKQMTGLPIDFQVIRASEANAKYADEPRNPIGLWRNHYGIPRGEMTNAEREMLAPIEQAPECAASLSVAAPGAGDAS